MTSGRVQLKTYVEDCVNVAAGQCGFVFRAVIDLGAKKKPAPRILASDFFLFLNSTISLNDDVVQQLNQPFRARLLQK